MARDKASLEAMQRALEKLVDTPVAELQGRRLEADDFNVLLTPDPTRDLLTWLNDPTGARQRWSPGEWLTFRSVCRQRFAFDPEKDGELAGAEHLGMRHGEWKMVWKRFTEAPKRFPRIPDSLRRAKPAEVGTLFHDRSSWPQENESAETQLRAALLSLGKESPQNARDRIEALEKEHGERRDWVWAELDQAPLALALRPLAELARLTRSHPGGGTPEEMAKDYVETGWRVDAAALEAMSRVGRQPDVQAVSAAINTVYRPWLEAAADHFQTVAKATPLPDRRVAAKAHTAEPGCCILFADGLRFDLGQRLRDTLADRGYSVRGGWRWSALPPVTSTAKPSVSPVCDLLGDDDPGQEFKPSITADGKTLTMDRFRQLLEQRGYQWLDPSQTGEASGRAWTEHGRIDRFGHDNGIQLAGRVADEIRSLADRIVALIQAGWREVRVVTDHGWLLLPGGLPKVEMPAYLAETRWGRCAVLKHSSKVDVPTVSWYWNEHVLVAVAPGVACFRAGTEYAHGGLSLQECVVPELVVTTAAAKISASIGDVRWLGLRCRVQGSGGGHLADIRLRAADSGSSLVAGGKPLAQDGSVSLLVEDDGMLGSAALVVLLDAAGNVLAKRPTTVGGEE